MRRLLFAAAAVLAVCVAQPAQAAQVKHEAGQPTIFEASPGEQNAVTVRLSGGNFEITDRGATITALADCSAGSDGHSATCPATPVSDRIGPTVMVDTGDEADSVNIDLPVGDAWPEFTEEPATALHAGVDAGAGDDTLSLTAADVSASGGDGNDVATVRAWQYSLDGGAGDDQLTADAPGVRATHDYLDVGDSTMNGGPGNDVLNGSIDGDRLDGDDGNDVLHGGGRRDLMSGGAGDDVLDGGDYPDRLDGGPGNDVLEGGLGGDQLFGGDGNDRLDGGDNGTPGDPAPVMADILEGGPGSDVLDGGPGPNDEVTYEDHMAPVHVTLDGLPNDGQEGEGDDVMTDGVVGGQGDDTIVGDARDNFLSGLSGDDVIVAGLGRDELVAGENGDDTLYSDDGGSGQLVGFPSLNSLGLPANYDDLVLCDGGGDIAYVDSRDIATDCALQSQASAPVGVAPGAVARIPVACPRHPNGSCSGVLSLRRAARRAPLHGLPPRRLSRALGKVRFSARPGRRRRARVRVAHRGRARHTMRLWPVYHRRGRPPVAP